MTVGLMIALRHVRTLCRQLAARFQGVLEAGVALAEQARYVVSEHQRSTKVNIGSWTRRGVTTRFELFEPG
jgi:hypothetical protein